MIKYEIQLSQIKDGQVLKTITLETFEELKNMRMQFGIEPMDALASVILVDKIDGTECPDSFQKRLFKALKEMRDSE